jgi:hypothetical protein
VFGKTLSRFFGKWWFSSPGCGPVRLLVVNFIILFSISNGTGMDVIKLKTNPLKETLFMDDFNQI